MKKIVTPSCIFLLLTLLSCGRPSPTFDNLDLKAWAADQHGCTNKRASMYDALDKQKEKLLGVSEIEMADLIGTPDEVKLYKRNQKFYYYYLEPSARCAPENVHPKKLVIRFNAMSLAKEVSITN